MSYYSLEQQAQALSQYLPDSIIFEAKYIDGSNLKDLIYGLAGEFERCQNLIDEFGDEFYPTSGIVMIEEWETALGIPDHCLSNTVSITDRQKGIIVKLAKMALQTVGDFVDLALMYDLSVTVSPAMDVKDIAPTISFNTLSDARNTIVVDISTPAAGGFPYAFPVIFGDAYQPIIECLMREGKPSHTQIIYRNI